MSENTDNAEQGAKSAPLKIMEIQQTTAHPGLALPKIESANSLLANRKQKPGAIIEGIAHAGTKVVLASGSKVGKTWILIAWLIAVVTGTRDD